VPWILWHVGLQAVGSVLCSSARSVSRSVSEVPSSVNAPLISSSQRLRITEYTIASCNIELFAEGYHLVGKGFSTAVKGVTEAEKSASDDPYPFHVVTMVPLLHRCQLGVECIT